MIVDRVEIGEPRAMERRAVLGASEVEGLELPDQPWSHRDVEIAGHVLRATRDPRRGAPALSLWLPSELGPEIETALAVQQLTLLTQQSLATPRIELE